MRSGRGSPSTAERASRSSHPEGCETVVEGIALDRTRLEKYIGTTAEALAKLTIAAPERSFNRRLADDFLTMARAYFEDSKEFARKGDLVNAFACVNYAHGWLDCGARIGLFEVGADDRLFTLYE